MLCCKLCEEVLAQFPGWTKNFDKIGHLKAKIVAEDSICLYSCKSRCIYPVVITGYQTQKIAEASRVQYPVSSFTYFQNQVQIKLYYYLIAVWWPLLNIILKMSTY